MELMSLIRLFRIAHFKPNLKADTEGLRPLISPADSFGRPEDDEHAIDLFIEELTLVDESDYGDFMRKVNLYLCQLKAHIRHRDHEILARVDSIQMQVQFCPNWSIGTTRPWVLQRAIELKIHIAEKFTQRARERRSGLAFVWPEPKPRRHPTWTPQST